MANSPVCNLPASVPKPSAPAQLLAAIPVATDIASAIAAVNALRTYVTYQLAHVNNQTGPSSITLPPKKGNNFVVINQQVKQVKVSNPDDPSQFVMVNQVVSLQLENQATGQTWAWQQPPSN